MGSPRSSDVIVEWSPAPFEGRFGRFEKVMGEGSSKTVYEAFDSETGKLVAWNMVSLAPLRPEDRERVREEVQILSTVAHPRIMEIYGTWATEESIVFITGICESGDLRTFYKTHRAKLKIIKRWCRQILSGLAYLHEHDPPLVHRDIKCENILYNASDGTVRISDLGLCKAGGEDGCGSADNFGGTWNFMAAEAFDGRVDWSVDIYAFGLTVCEMVTRELPYKECNWCQIYMKVSQSIFPDAFYRIKYPSVQEFIRYCTQLLPETGTRPTARALLAHPFLDESTHAPEDESDDLVWSGADAGGAEYGVATDSGGAFGFEGDDHRASGESGSASNLDQLLGGERGGVPQGSMPAAANNAEAASAGSVESFASASPRSGLTPVRTSPSPPSPVAAVAAELSSRTTETDSAFGPAGAAARSTPHAAARPPLPPLRAGVDAGSARISAPEDTELTAISSRSGLSDMLAGTGARRASTHLSSGIDGPTPSYDSGDDLPDRLADLPAGRRWSLDRDRMMIRQDTLARIQDDAHLLAGADSRANVLAGRTDDDARLRTSPGADALEQVERTDDVALEHNPENDGGMPGSHRETQGDTYQRLSPGMGDGHDDGAGLLDESLLPDSGLQSRIGSADGEEGREGGGSLTSLGSVLNGAMDSYRPDSTALFAGGSRGASAHSMYAPEGDAQAFSPNAADADAGVDLHRMSGDFMSGSTREPGDTVGSELRDLIAEEGDRLPGSSMSSRLGASDDVESRRDDALQAGGQLSQEDADAATLDEYRGRPADADFFPTDQETQMYGGDGEPADSGYMDFAAQSQREFPEHADEAHGQSFQSEPVHDARFEEVADGEPGYGPDDVRAAAMALVGEHERFDGGLRGDGRESPLDMQRQEAAAEGQDTSTAAFLEVPPPPRRRSNSVGMHPPFLIHAEAAARDEPAFVPAPLGPVHAKEVDLSTPTELAPVVVFDGVNLNAPGVGAAVLTSQSGYILPASPRLAAHAEAKLIGLAAAAAPGPANAIGSTPVHVAPRSTGPPIRAAVSTASPALLAGGAQTGNGLADAATDTILNAQERGGDIAGVQPGYMEAPGMTLPRTPLAAHDAMPPASMRLLTLTIDHDPQADGLVTRASMTFEFDKDTMDVFQTAREIVQSLMEQPTITIDESGIPMFAAFLATQKFEPSVSLVTGPIEKWNWRSVRLAPVPEAGGADQNGAQGAGVPMQLVPNSPALASMDFMSPAPFSSRSRLQEAGMPPMPELSLDAASTGDVEQLRDLSEGGQSVASTDGTPVGQLPPSSLRSGADKRAGFEVSAPGLHGQPASAARRGSVVSASGSVGRRFGVTIFSPRTPGMSALSTGSDTGITGLDVTATPPTSGSGSGTGDDSLISQATMHGEPPAHAQLQLPSTDFSTAASAHSPAAALPPPHLHVPSDALVAAATGTDSGLATATTPLDLMSGTPLSPGDIGLSSPPLAVSIAGGTEGFRSPSVVDDQWSGESNVSEMSPPPGVLRDAGGTLMSPRNEDALPPASPRVFVPPSDGFTSPPGFSMSTTSSPARAADAILGSPPPAGIAYPRTYAMLVHGTPGSVDGKHSHRSAYTPTASPHSDFVLSSALQSPPGNGVPAVVTGVSGPLSKAGGTSGVSAIGSDNQGIAFPREPFQADAADAPVPQRPTTSQRPPLPGVAGSISVKTDAGQSQPQAPSVNIPGPSPAADAIDTVISNIVSLDLGSQQQTVNRPAKSGESTPSNNAVPAHPAKPPAGKPPLPIGSIPATSHAVTPGSAGSATPGGASPAMLPRPLGGVPPAASSLPPVRAPPAGAAPLDLMFAPGMGVSPSVTPAFAAPAGSAAMGVYAFPVHQALPAAGVPPFTMHHPYPPQPSPWGPSPLPMAAAGGFGGIPAQPGLGTASASLAHSTLLSPTLSVTSVPLSTTSTAGGTAGSVASAVTHDPFDFDPFGTGK